MVIVEDVAMDSVVIVGQVVKRPSAMSRDEWMHFWESVLKWDRGECILEHVKQEEYQ